MIRRGVEEVSPLVIAIVGYNREQATNALLTIVRDLNNSEDKIEKFNKFLGIAKTQSGIIYKIAHDNIDGYRFDQLIIADDNRWSTIVEQSGLIDFIVNRLDDNIPGNYKVQYLEV